MKRSSTVVGMLVQFAQILDGSRVHLFRHTVKVDQEAYKDLVARGAIFVDAVQVAQDSDARNVLPMESQNTVGLSTHRGAGVGGGHLPVQMLVLHIVCRGDFGEETSHHLNDVLYGHAADLVLRTLVPTLLSEALAVIRKGLRVIVRQALDVRQVFDFDATGWWRGGRAVGRD